MAVKISICIPTYNRKNYLKETLKSIFLQTYKDYEVVIVDDGSTDGTEEMLKKGEYPIRYYWQRNAGDAAARNKLIELARGQYISFIDSDDLLPPDAIELMVSAVPDGAENVVVYGPYTAIDEYGNVCRRKRKRLYSGFITQHLFENILVHSCGSMFPTKILHEAGGFDESLPVCSDYDLWLRLSLKYRFVAINKAMFKRRRHSGNLSQMTYANSKTEFEVLEKFYYDGGGKNKISKRRAKKRLSKEGYRAARCAIREGLQETARQLLRQSFQRSPNFKSIFWLTIASYKLHPALFRQDKMKDNISSIRVAFDLNAALVNRYSGFYAVGTGLLEGFENIEEKPDFLLFHSKRFSSEANSVKNRLGNWAQLRSTSIKMRWLEDFWQISKYLKLEFFTGGFDIYHSLQHLMPPNEGKVRILTVHDLRRYVLPELYKKSKLTLFESAIAKSDHFIAVSESTKKDLCRIFSIPQDKVDVVHLSANKKFRPIDKEKKVATRRMLSEEFGIELNRYFIVLSSPDRRKNISRIIEAFFLAKKGLPENIKLVVIGNLPKRDRMFESIDFDAISESVLVTGPLDSITDVFSCAEALIFASLYEGFGIPILEAFACGVPVITSNCSSMPEVGSDAALYVDPYSIESIAEATVKIGSDIQLREDLIERGFKRNENFSWERTAEKTFNVYKKLLS